MKHQDNMTKDKGIYIRLSESEKEHFSMLAKEQGLTLSEYARIKMLYEDGIRYDKHQERLASFVSHMYYGLTTVFRKQLSNEEIAKAQLRAEKQLEAWGYKQLKERG